MQTTFDFSTLYAHPLISTVQLEQIKAVHRQVSFKKGDFILQKGEISKSYFALQIGIARSFVYDYDGNDITTGFFCEQEFVINELSLFKQEPSLENIVALTDCTAWEVSFADFQVLYHSIAGFSEWGRLFMTEKLFQTQRRFLEMITLPAKDRYLQFLKEKPQVLQNVALKHIATYLGITDTSLSRIRKEI
ncbi:cyclic nucleotide-binding protein [Capnocytophaga stomatis]|uniref:Cyclic nucleotide-binding protein n=1 Tax=Capnocytophaga stomatis TaxID=1848904 RepID=A0A250FY55_9FLAO|nr:Crp/Fnr family transcriptional regulator [Capnocytophaga stomatis]ATA90003.1 cyclic nucleotide-binding protein [Capnocytophaga stomatis]